MSATNPSPAVIAEGELPEGWAKAALGALSQGDSSIAYGVLKPGPRCTGGIPLLRVKDIVGGIVDASDVYRITPQLDAQYRRTKLDGNEVLLSIQGTVGRVAIVPLELAGANISRTLAVIRPAWPELARWLWIALQAPQIREAIAEDTAGTTRDSLNLRDLRRLQLVVPPFVEQKRIVEKVDQLLARVNAARDRLTRVPAILKRFRQAVLAAACSGRLTADWRESEGNAESTHDLIARINSGTFETSVPDNDDSIEKPELPDTWGWAYCGDICDPKRAITYGVIKLGSRVEGGIPTLRSSDVRWLRIESDQVKCISPKIAAAYSRTFLKGGEILVTVRGTLGGVAVVPEQLAGFNISREVALLPIQADLNAKFFSFAVGCVWSQNWLTQVTKGVAYTGINIRDLKRLPVPVPPTGEQDEIVHRVEALFKLADAIEERVAAATARAEKLTQAILAKAFRGELVPTEAELARREGRSYEPASALLARIRAERESSAGSSHSCRTSALEEPMTRRSRKVRSK